MTKTSLTSMIRRYVSRTLLCHYPSQGHPAIANNAVGFDQEPPHWVDCAQYTECESSHVGQLGEILDGTLTLCDETTCKEMVRQGRRIQEAVPSIVPLRYLELSEGVIEAPC